jgi:hypothetical protein
MNDRYQETGAPPAPLILTVPAYSFVVALHLHCLGLSNRVAFSAEAFAKEVEPVDSARLSPPEPEFLKDTRRPTTRWAANLFNHLSAPITPATILTPPRRRVPGFGLVGGIIAVSRFLRSHSLALKPRSEALEN